MRKLALLIFLLTIIQVNDSNASILDFLDRVNPFSGTNNNAVEKRGLTLPNKNSQPVTRNETSQPEEKDETEKTRIALLLPLSGNSQAIGKAMLDSAELALFDIGEKNIIILPIDTGVNDDDAKKAGQKAVDEGAQLILGPLTSSATRAVAPIAEPHGINVISFSNDKTLLPEKIFLFGFMPEQQIARVMKYAASKGLHDFSGFFPDNEFGKIVSDEFMKDAAGLNVKVDVTDSYTLPENMEMVDLSKAAEVKTDEADAILVPEGGARLSTIAKIIRTTRTEDNSKVRLLGSGQWDDPSILKYSVLHGSWFASSPPARTKYFVKHFSETYGYEPPRIASLAYDAVALAVFLQRSSADFSASAITNPVGFSAINGIFRFRDDGVCERGLSVLEVGKKDFIEIDPAPQSFTNLGY